MDSEDGTCRWIHDLRRGSLTLTVEYFDPLLPVAFLPFCLSVVVVPNNIKTSFNCSAKLLIAEPPIPVKSCSSSKTAEMECPIDR